MAIHKTAWQKVGWIVYGKVSAHSVTTHTNPVFSREGVGAIPFSIFR